MKTKEKNSSSAAPEGDWRDTLNLPQTDFPMRADLPTREPEIARTWEAHDVYRKTVDRPGAPVFVLHDGPPYSNGDIHLGHALNKTLKDIIVKYRAMQGFSAPYVPGWDNHGLPIEVNVMKEFRAKKETPDKVTLRKRCREYAAEYVARQRDQFKRLGIRGDWDDPYLTMSTVFEAEIVKVFGELAQKGFIYRGLKPVYWCPTDETALADAEIEYVEGKKDPSIYVRFPLKDDPHGVFPADAPKETCWTIIWTTTPWTIPSNLAVAVSPVFDYVVAKTASGDHYLVADALLKPTMEAAGIAESDYEVVKVVQGHTLHDLVFRHPLHGLGEPFDRDSVLVFADYVTTDDGTGVVHTAPGHGKEDFQTGQKYGLPVLQPVLSNGVYDETAGEFAGLHINEGGKKVIERLREAGNLLSEQQVVHSYPHCWRCHNPVIFRATVQWFMNIDHDGFRGKALDAIKTVEWYPGESINRISAMVAGRPDWCVSRQRAWGVGIPVFYYNGEPIITPESVAKVYEMTLREGSDAWYEKTPREILGDDWVCPLGGSVDEYTKETDVLDVWFDSGSTCRAVLEHRPELHYPADVYLEGSDQHRGWFNSSLMIGTATRGEAPYRQVITNGWTLDDKGKAMHKSAGNAIPPANVVQMYGADVLRLWVGSTNYFEDVRLGQKILDQTANAYRGIRNPIRFLLGGLYDFDPAKDRVAPADLTELDRYALDRLQRLIGEVTRGYETYEFHRAIRAINDYCAGDLSAFYLNVIKDRLYASGANSRERRSTQTALYDICSSLVRMLAPILSFTAEEAWQMLPGATALYPSVELAPFPAPDTALLDEELAARWRDLLTLRDEVNKALEEAKANGLKKPMETRVTLAGDFPAAEGFSDEDLALVFVVSQVERKAAADGSGPQVQVGAAIGRKCERCWLIKRDVGADTLFPKLCERCADVLRARNAAG
jgi:isoleucyl-tRNA synthetase